MSIASEISRLQTAKTDIKTAIEAKGVIVPSSATIDTYDDYVSQISGGGGSTADTQALIDLIERDITSIEIPSGVTSIGDYAFYYCNSLSSATIPSGVTSIGDNAFYYCSGLTSLEIPESVIIIGLQSFYECKSLSSITIPNSVTTVGNNIFRNCSNLLTIVIGSGITNIGAYAFYGCSHLTSITINAATPPALGNNVFMSTNDCPIYVPAESVETYKSASGWSTYASRIQAIPNS